MTLLQGASLDNKSSHSDLVNHEPTYRVYPKRLYRSLPTVWYTEDEVQERTWLVYRFACRHSALPSWPNVERAYTDHSFGNWKKALETRGHEKCQSYLTADFGAAASSRALSPPHLLAPPLRIGKSSIALYM